MEAATLARKLVGIRFATRLVVLATLAVVFLAGAPLASLADAQVRISASQAREQASRYIYNRASTSGRIYQWGVGECRQLSRSRAGCMIWWTQGVLKWAKTCRQRLDYRVDRDGALWLTKFYPACVPRRA